MSDDATKHSEYLTRKRLIDGRLKNAGWQIVSLEKSRQLFKLDRCAVEEYPTENGKKILKGQ